MFYDMTGNVGDLSHEEFLQALKKETVIEIWNDVFMEYEKKGGKVVGKLKQKNVDTGAGLERMTAVMQGKQTAYDTEIFQNIMSAKIFSEAYLDEKSKRIIADHMRTSVFLISDGVIPGNTGQGYVLRRLLRRAIYRANKKGEIAGSSHLDGVIIEVVRTYKDAYPGVEKNLEKIRKIVAEEESRFMKTLAQGLKEFERGIDPFILATTYGFPIELTLELAKENGASVDLEDFKKKMAEHQKLSQTASAGMFKGGLANHNEQTIKLHTAHHLLLAGLQAVVDKNIKQRGSNITEERLRMDFLCDHKLTDEEKQKVEDWVNEKIKLGLNVVRKEMPLAEAEKLGAQMEFGAKYPEIVSVYFIEDKEGSAISKEFCGGPHVKNIRELGQFKIQKEEAVAAGIRRIKAILL
jgi:alanyl-tRNA synthetase